MSYREETVLHWQVGEDPIPHSLAEFTNRLYGAALSIPAEYRDTAQIDLEPAYEFGESYAQVRVTYQRPETPEERAAYVAERKAQIASVHERHLAWMAERAIEVTELESKP